ncbi:polysaccharide biosynthesis/export family protein [Flavobacterium cellulosilyticum]|uniref:Polysaccharide export protein n=1 Tax=Flavobacterium cellulosilyticum TaxID=2541731 RepID=A0A4R5C8W2_9FLAO|nr:polysaccharide biosynthesis/export family protein [Flavobacterium cellulosilyticum]TDD95076.1 polysaccharide export protein [Flavobacterium cellulosilyticum]
MNILRYFTFVLILFMASCASKKDILYFQDASSYPSVLVSPAIVLIQSNDILHIQIGALVPETALPYNFQTATSSVSTPNLETLKIEGYLVSSQGTIILPVLGTLLVAGQTVYELEDSIRILLEKGGHLIHPAVSIRILNAKFTVLGEVKLPGTYSFMESSLSVPQALGYAGDLTIAGKRNNILLIRNSAGVQTISHIDMTTANWMNNPDYQIRQNDLLVVNPNNAKVKTAGYVGNTGTLLTIASLLLSSIILLTR